MHLYLNIEFRVFLSITFTNIRAKRKYKLNAENKFILLFISFPFA